LNCVGFQIVDIIMQVFTYVKNNLIREKYFIFYEGNYLNKVESNRTTKMVNFVYLE